VDAFFPGISQKHHIIREPEQHGPEFGMNVIFSFELRLETVGHGLFLRFFLPVFKENLMEVLLKLGFINFLVVAVMMVLVWMAGLRMMERTITRRRPEYEDYIRRTSAFIPWFSKKGS
jgi:protein-S-isoprenylcysteine O-methyltransferase Ste14